MLSEGPSSQIVIFEPNLLSGFWTLKPYYLGTWARRVSFAQQLHRIRWLVEQSRRPGLFTPKDSQTLNYGMHLKSY